MTELDIPKKGDLKAIPRDEIIDGAIIDLKVKTWGEITKNEEKKKSLKDPDGKVLLVKYEVNGLLRNDIFPFTDKPKIGRAHV